MQSERQNHETLIRMGITALGLVGIVGCAGVAGTVAEPGGLVANANVASNANAVPSSAVPQEAPTYYADVLPIVAENCVDCHQPQGKDLGGMVAPFSLASYEDAKPWARVMALRVTEGTMPPWHPHPVHKGTFVGERYLADEDKETIVAWADAGAPAGDPAAVPAKTKAVLESILTKSQDSRDWWIGEPDLVLGFAEPYFVEDEIRDLNVTVNLQVDGQTLATAVHRADRDAATRSFSPVPAY